MSLGSLGSLVVSLTAETAQFTGAMDKAAYTTHQRMKAMEESARVAGLAIAAGLGVAAAATVAMVKSSIDAQDALAKLSTRTGLAVETLAGLKLAAESSDTSMEALGTSVGRLQKYIGEASAGNKQYQAVLKGLGITARDPEQALIQLADATTRLQEPNQKAAYLSQILGKSYQELLPLLEGGGEALRKMIDRGKEINPVTAESSRQAALFNDQLTDMKIQAEGVAATMANPLLPAMNDLLKNFNTALDLSRQAGGLGFMDLIIRGINPLSSAGQKVEDVRRQIEDVKRQKASAMPWADTSKFDEEIAKLERVKKKLQEIAQAEALADSAAWLDYKVAKSPVKPLNLPPLSGSGAASAKDKLDVLDPFYAQRKAAMDAAARAAQESKNAAFEEAESLRAYQEQAAERAAAAWGQMRDSIVRAIDPLQQYRDQLDDLDKLIEYQNEHGLVLITDEQVTEYRFRVQEMMEQAAGFGQAMEKQVDEFQKLFQENFQKGLADFLFDPFQDGLDGMVAGFGRMLQRMAADAIAADITRYLFGDPKTFGSGGTGILSSLVDMLPKFDVGTPFVPSDMLAVVHKGEAIVPAKYNKPGGMGGTTVNVSIQASDLGSFQRSEGQISAALSRAINSARRFQ